MTPTLCTYATQDHDIQTPFDICVIIPTILRPSLTEALRSVFAQDFDGRVQILIGIDQSDPFFDFSDILSERPDHMAVTIFWPGYSTNTANGGLHNILGGGAMRSLLSFMANGRALCYLDDDNWFSSNHLSSLHKAIEGKDWAFSYRWFVDEKTRRVICKDRWESVGPGKGVFDSNFNGFVDTNCLMVDTLACTRHLGAWSLAQHDGRGADRSFFKAIAKENSYGQTEQATSHYVIQQTDTNHQARLDFIKNNNIAVGEDQNPDWDGQPNPLPKQEGDVQHSGAYHIFGDHNRLFDCAVIIPTIGRATLKQAVQSIYQQDYQGRVQILIGLDKGQWLADLEDGLPDHMGLVLFDPGYSTSTRHSGMFEAHDGGALRTILSYLAHAPYVAYLDDDNRWRKNHLSSLMQAITDHHYAYGTRMFIHPDGQTEVAADYWESIGPNQGFYAHQLKGFVDPNCLMIDIKACVNVLPLWTKPLDQDIEKMSADRRVFRFLATMAKGCATGQISVDYVMNEDDPMHPLRTMYLGYRWINAEMASLSHKRFFTTSQER